NYMVQLSGLLSGEVSQSYSIGERLVIKKQGSALLSFHLPLQAGH
ncbi:MAG: hypothetical protein ACI9SF_000611, partial [Candidatus Nanohaloarchaea archaeon]